MVDLKKLFRALVLGGAAIGAVQCGPAGPQPAPTSNPDGGQANPDGGSPSFW